MHNICKLLIILLILISSKSFAANDLGKNVYIHTSFVQAQRTAKQQKKLILIHFWTENCGPCKIIASKIFPKAEFKNFAQKEFVYVSLDANTEKTLAKLYDVTSVPRDVIIKPNMDPISNYTPSTDINTYIKTAISAKNKFKESIRSKQSKGSK